MPICLYIITHVYFCSYHAFTTPILRRVWTAFPSGVTRWVVRPDTYTALALAQLTGAGLLGGSRCCAFAGALYCLYGNVDNFKRKRAFHPHAVYVIAAPAL